MSRAAERGFLRHWQIRPRAQQQRLAASKPGRGGENRHTLLMKSETTIPLHSATDEARCPLSWGVSPEPDQLKS